MGSDSYIRDWAAQPVLGDVPWVGRVYSVHSLCAKVDSVVLVWKRGWGESV